MGAAWREPQRTEGDLTGRRRARREHESNRRGDPTLQPTAGEKCGLVLSSPPYRRGEEQTAQQRERARATCRPAAAAGAAPTARAGAPRVGAWLGARIGARVGAIKGADRTGDGRGGVFCW